MEAQFENVKQVEGAHSHSVHHLFIVTFVLQFDDCMKFLRMIVSVDGEFSESLNKNNFQFKLFESIVKN